MLRDRILAWLKEAAAHAPGSSSSSGSSRGGAGGEEGPTHSPPGEPQLVGLLCHPSAHYTTMTLAVLAAG